MTKVKTETGIAPARRAHGAVEDKPGRAAAAVIDSMAGASAYLGARVDLERVKPKSSTRELYRLDRMRELLRVLGNPHENVRMVHVAGTKGKGSTCWMVSAMLEGCGYTVGLFTSPHLVDVRERIMVNRRPVSEEDFVRLTRAVAEAAAVVEGPGGMGQTTYFELMTAMGFLHFAEQAVDAAVVEVGLGGLLDCTNVITPEVAAVATIGLDHTQILGETVEEIAAQKAGIYKAGVPALIVDQAAGVVETARRVAERVGAPLTVVGKDVDYSFRVEHPPAGTGGWPTARLSLTTRRWELEHVAVPLAGEHQAHNCALALSIVDALADRGFDLPVDSVLAGLATTKVPGRFEVVGQSPRVLLDGAHNADSVKALMKTIGQWLQYDALVVIFGCAADKDVGPMLRALSMGADKVIFTKAADNQRAADPAKLAKMFSDIDGKPAMHAPDLAAAVELAKRSLTSNDVLAVTGSLYLIGDAKRLMMARAGGKKK
ncbi:MAG: folylpolyglutamate synthase/dihydrofolate synthase family protein [Phycisphaerales bacterium]|nr:folylpolyglutamate synthase/dihydrofolate synthase family protein [Phycisphaerales bacterium]